MDLHAWINSIGTQGVAGFAFSPLSNIIASITTDEDDYDQGYASIFLVWAMAFNGYQYLPPTDTTYIENEMQSIPADNWYQTLRNGEYCALPFH